MKPRQPIPRISKKRLASNGGKTPFLKRSSIRKKTRKPSEFKRIYGSKQRVEWVKSLGCVYCRMIFGSEYSGGEIHNAHTENGGRGRKADYTTIIPLCRAHHQAYDEHRAPLASDFIREKLKAAARTTNEAWLAFSKGSA